MPPESTSVEALLQRAAEAHRRGQYESCLHLLRRVFDQDTDFGAAQAAHYVASFPAQDRRLLWSAPPGLFAEPARLENTFETIHARGVWGRGSGAGSHIRNTAIYAAYVQHLLDRLSVRSIVDLGCGDWQTAKCLDLSGRDYLGVDIAPSVIAANTRDHGRPNIKFLAADVTAFDVPPCDLLLCKDVLQHLSNANVGAMLARAGRARCAVFTNDYHGANDDCVDGNTRPLDITRPPFQFSARPRLTFLGKVTFVAGDRGACR